ncbi:MAG: hypothetical protein ACE5JI_02420 [Acidobacteriota bacterium]
MGDRQWFVLYVLVCLEVGIFLALVPWSVLWERNYFLQTYPGLRFVVLEPAFRGAVSGLGVANVFVALREIVHRRRLAASPLELFPGGFSKKPGTEKLESPSVGHVEEPKTAAEARSRAFATREESS